MRVTFHDRRFQEALLVSVVVAGLVAAGAALLTGTAVAAAAGIAAAAVLIAADLVSARGVRDRGLTMAAALGLGAVLAALHQAREATVVVDVLRVLGPGFGPVVLASLGTLALGAATCPRFVEAQRDPIAEAARDLAAELDDGGRVLVARALDARARLVRAVARDDDGPGPFRRRADAMSGDEAAARLAADEAVTLVARDLRRLARLREQLTSPTSRRGVTPQAALVGPGDHAAQEAWRQTRAVLAATAQRRDTLERVAHEIEARAVARIASLEGAALAWAAHRASDGDADWRRLDEVADDADRRREALRDLEPDRARTESTGSDRERAAVEAIQGRAAAGENQERGPEAADQGRDAAAVVAGGRDAAANR